LQIWTDFFDKSQPEKFLFVYAERIEAGKFLETFNVSKENVLVNLYFFLFIFLGVRVSSKNIELQEKMMTQMKLPCNFFAKHDFKNFLLIFDLLIIIVFF
jgi:hypothetical protein